MKNIKTVVSKIKIPKKLMHINIVRMLGLYRFKTSAIILTAIAVFLGSNFLLSVVSLRADFSNGQAYTLSKSTKQIVRGLEKTATVTLYTSNNLPARLQPIQREVVDMLREYGRAGGNVHLNIISFNPAEDQTTAQAAQTAGIMPQPVRQQEQSQVSLTEIFFGITVGYNEKNEVIAQAFDVENLEYNLTAALYKMTQENLPKVGVIGAPEPDYMSQQPVDPLAALRQVAGKLFDIQTIDVPPAPSDEIDTTSTDTTPFTIDPSYKTILVMDSPNVALTDTDIAEVKKYLQTGNGIFFLNGMSIDDSLQTGEGNTALLSFLAKYGIEVKPDLMLSARSEFVNMGGNGYSLMVPYPLWIWAADFDTNANYFSGIGRLTFPWGSSVHAKGAKGFDVRELVWSSQDSWAQTGTFILDPQSIPQPSQSDLKKYPLVAESKPEKAGKVMVIGSSRFIQSNFISQQSQNLEFILNVLTEYASDGLLSGIRSRTINLYPLPELPQQAQEFYKYGNILLLPLLFAFYGAYRLWMRGKRMYE